MDVQAPTDLGTTKSGMQPNFAATLSYALWIVTGLVFFLTEPDNKFVRFNAMQAILLPLASAVVSFVLAFIPIIGWLALPIWHIGIFVMWIVCMVQAYKGRWFRLPFIGNIAAKQAGLPA